MRFCFSIAAFLFCVHGSCGQETFYDFYKLLQNVGVDYQVSYKKTEQRSNIDTSEKRAAHAKEVVQYRKDIAKLMDKIAGVPFPDISFTDLSLKAHSISDFKGELVINYNYMFCHSCMSRIDSTHERTADKNTRLLILFGEIYRNDVALLKMYDDRVLIGFINDDTKDFISFNQGDDCMYYLDEDHNILFFDQWNAESWIKFLDKHNK